MVCFHSAPLPKKNGLLPKKKLNKNNNSHIKLFFSVILVKCNGYWLKKNSLYLANSKNSNLLHD